MPHSLFSSSDLASERMIRTGKFGVRRFKKKKFQNVCFSIEKRILDSLGGEAALRRVDREKTNAGHY